MTKLIHVKSLENAIAQYDLDNCECYDANTNAAFLNIILHCFDIEKNQIDKNAVYTLLHYADQSIYAKLINLESFDSDNKDFCKKFNYTIKDLLNCNVNLDYDDIYIFYNSTKNTKIIMSISVFIDLLDFIATCRLDNQVAYYVSLVKASYAYLNSKMITTIIHDFNAFDISKRDNYVYEVFYNIRNSCDSISNLNKHNINEVAKDLTSILELYSINYEYNNSFYFNASTKRMLKDCSEINFTAFNQILILYTVETAFHIIRHSKTIEDKLLQEKFNMLRKFLLNLEDETSNDITYIADKLSLLNILIVINNYSLIALMYNKSFDRYA